MFKSPNGSSQKIKIIAKKARKEKKTKWQLKKQTRKEIREDSPAPAVALRSNAV